MEIIVSGQEMKLCDQNTIHYFQMSALVLMERAAIAAADEILKINAADSSVLIVCGTGNNGGDGLAIARLLFLQGRQVDVVLLGNKEKATAETKHQLACLKKYGLAVMDRIPDRSYKIIVDCIFGIGLTREILGRDQSLQGEGAPPDIKTVIEAMNQMSGYKIAVDMPSGIHADSGAVMGAAFQADLTITFAYNKLGNLLYPGCAYAGQTLVKDIGISKESWLDQVPMLWQMTEADLHLVPQRRAASNKGSYGKVLIAAGKRNMAGAAFLSGKAAYATGCGLVYMLCEECNREIIQGLLPEAVLAAYHSDIAEADLNKLLEEALINKDVIVAGPGLGTSKEANRLIQQLLQKTDRPLILDADALNLVASQKQLLKTYPGDLILTPHLGEMARLCGKDIPYIQKNLLAVARDFANEYGVICVLKDARTVTALPDGVAYLNCSGNSGMAAAGSGDVLTGLLAGLIAQGAPPLLAAPLGVFLHGLAGDRAALCRGQFGMMAHDIIEGIVMTMKEKVEQVFDRKGGSCEKIR